MNMTESENNTVRKSYLSAQRRTQSIDQIALQNLGQEVHQSNNNCTRERSENGALESVRDDDYPDYSDLSKRTNGRSRLGTYWRSRRVFAPSPKCNFGPKGTLKSIKAAEQIVIQDPSNQRLHWITQPNDILIIRKPGPSTVSEFQTLLVYLLKRDLNVYIQLSDQTHTSLETKPDLQKHAERCITFDQARDLATIDLVVCLGGDGTLLHTSGLFQRSCPPILSFSMGSLGFLTPFDFKFHEDILNNALRGDVAVLLRTRLNCTIIKNRSDDASKSSAPHLSLRPHDSVAQNSAAAEEEETDANLALNEIVIDRGPNSYLSNLDLYINDRFITKVQGDGLVISTPTGSTAYAMAAGASMVHPNVPAIVICPICAHSLSFRPIVIPAGIELTVKVSADTRLNAWISIDGRTRLELTQNDSVKITTSVYTIPSICRLDPLGDWFESLADTLHWNLRKTQKGFNAEEDS